MQLQGFVIITDKATTRIRYNNGLKKSNYKD